jgi:hypothetical protein
MLSITHFDWRSCFSADNLSGRVNRPAAATHKKETHCPTN